MVRIALSGLLALALATIAGASAQAQPGIDALMVRVGERVAEFYARAKNVICVETSTVQAVDLSNSLVGFARTVESELRIEAGGGGAPGEAAIVRKVRKVNGRPPRERDAKDRSGCTDPEPLSIDSLAFLLPANRPGYEFRIAGFTEDRGRPALAIEFATVERRSRAALIEAPSGHDDCFDWTGHLAARGRVVVDADSYDVLRVDRHLRGPVDVRVPPRLQRRYRFDNWVVLVRDDVTIRYKTIAFTDPDEELLLPESIDTYTLVRGGLQSTRRHQRFSAYQRFVTGGRVVE